MKNNCVKNSVQLNIDERLDDLQLNGLKIIQKKDGYCFTSDSVLLANFVRAKKSESLLEIGAGTGIISILVNQKQCPKQITMLEIQEKYAQLAQRNLLYNDIKNIYSIMKSIV